MNRNEMIKWLSENTTREQWVYGSKLQGDDKDWITSLSNKSGEIVVLNIDDISVKGIKINDVFEPVSEQPVYIDGGIYEIGVMNGEPQQFVYNLKLNMFERGSNESIGASNVHDSKVVTHFKLVQGPSSEHDTVAKEIINNIRYGVDNEFMDSSAVTSEPQGLLNHRREPSSAVKILNDAAECIGDRAAERDTDSERSMSATVNAFNAMYGAELTETQGWMFLAFLKASRAKGGTFREDDYTDGAAYFALAGECDGNVRR